VPDFTIFGFCKKVTFDNFSLNLLHHHDTHSFFFRFTLSTNIDDMHYSAGYYLIISSETAEVKVTRFMHKITPTLAFHPTPQRRSKRISARSPLDVQSRFLPFGLHLRSSWRHDSPVQYTGIFRILFLVHDFS
jgi:hypothetical protein